MERLALKAERAIKEGMSDMDVRKMIRDELRDMRDGIKREVVDELKEHVLEPIPGLVTKQLPETLEAFGKELYKAATSKVTNSIIDIVQTAAPNTLPLQIGPLVVVIPEVQDKIDSVQHYLKNPPNFKDKDQALKFVKDIGAASVSLDLSVGLGLVVQSDSLQLKANPEWAVDDFVDRYDEIVAAVKTLF